MSSGCETICSTQIPTRGSEKFIRIKLTKESLFELVEGGCIKIVLEMES